MRPGILAICSLAVYMVLSPFLKPIAENKMSMNAAQSGITDEKEYYVLHGHGTIDIIKRQLNDKPDSMRFLRQTTF